jgi:hypothetical protein
MPAPLDIMELPPVLLARGRRDDLHQDIRGDVRLANNLPQALAVHVILCQHELRYMVAYTQCEP